MPALLEGDQVPEKVLLRAAVLEGVARHHRDDAAEEGKCQMSWKHIVIEGICFGDTKLKGNPCGKAPSVHCLEEGHCPFLAYAESSEREAAHFVPLHLVIWDKIKGQTTNTSWKLRWWLWRKWRYNPDWIKKYPVKECPEWDAHMKKMTEDFPCWLEKTKESID